jgi:hypothetical protein
MGHRVSATAIRAIASLTIAGAMVLMSGYGIGEGQSLRTNGNATPFMVTSTIRVFPAPGRMRVQCRRAQKYVSFPVLCPTVMPHARDGTAPATFAQWADYPKPVKAKWLYVGGLYGGSETDPQDWSGNDPAVFFHFFVFEGNLSPTLLNLRGVPHPQQFIGRRTLGGHLGDLYKQVSYSLCSDCSFTGHITFIWKEHGATYAASLHRWSLRPSASEVALLATLITHLRRVA